jgi:type IV pilus assembly protein PilX
MIATITSARRHQRGIALISALLILLVVTILGMAMFRGYGMQQRIGGNSRDKSRAFHSAMAAQDYAEWWLTANSGTDATATTTCSASESSLPVATSTSAMACTNVITESTVAQPSSWGGGFVYQVPNMNTTSGAQGSYSQYPQFYISYLGSPNSSPTYKSTLGQNQVLFQVDAAGYGATAQTVAVVESTYVVSSISTSIPPSSSGTVQKDVSLGGP